MKLSAQLTIGFSFHLFNFLNHIHSILSIFDEKHGYSTFVSVTQNIIEYLHFGLSLEILISFNVVTL